jgi:hypothetical protein
LDLNPIAIVAESIAHLGRHTPHMQRARAACRGFQPAAIVEARHKIQPVQTEAARTPTCVGPADLPIPILSPEQHRFLRFLLDLADDVDVRGESSATKPNDPTLPHRLSRLHAAVRLFERSPTSPEDTDAIQ